MPSIGLGDDYCIRSRLPGAQASRYSRSPMRAFQLCFYLFLSGWIQMGSSLLAQPQEADTSAKSFWPQWRGPTLDGVAPRADPPIRWSESENVAWKVEIPGRGASTPIIWGDRIFLQTAIDVGPELPPRKELQNWQEDGTKIYQGLAYVPSSRVKRLLLLSLDRRTGETIWERALHEEQPLEGRHPTNTWASASPSTDGEVLVSFFGSHGLYVLNLEGALLWQKDFGQMNTRNGWGEGSSPSLSGDEVVVNWDHEGDSFLAVFDKRSGKERWKQKRDEMSSWFTPLVVTHRGRRQIVTSGAGQVRGYDLETGEELWYGPGLTPNSIPTPVAGQNRVYLTSGYSATMLLAVDLERARGDLEAAEAIAWRYERDTPYVASPLLYGNSIYFFKHLRGILTSLNAATGQLNYGPLRIPELNGVYASPLGAAGRVYLAGRAGNTVVIEHGAEYKVLAVNHLEDGFDASPVAVDRELYLRGRKYLYRISEAPRD